MSRTTISIDKSVADLVRERARRDNVSVSTILAMLAKGYAEKRINIGVQMAEESEVEIIATSPEVQKRMDRIESLL